jgi:hypothetical protein
VTSDEPATPEASPFETLDAPSPIHMGPPGRLFGVMCVVVWLLSIVAASGDDFFGVVLLFFTSGGVLLVWLVRALVFAALTRLRMPAPHVLRWLAVPVGFGLVWVLVLIDAPAWLRFEASRPWMEQAAAKVAGGGAIADGWIGLWPATGVERLPGGMRFVVDGAGLLDSEGFAYSADGTLESIQSADDYSSYERIDDHWFHWLEGWD